MELSEDHKTVMTLAESQGNGALSLQIINQELEWPQQRIDVAMQILLREGLVWVDNQGEHVEYWFPSLWPNWRV